MVLYNSPLAVAALLVGLVAAVIAMARLVRALRAPSRTGEQNEGLDTSGKVSPVIREMLRSETRDIIIAAIAITVFTAILVWAVMTDIAR